MIHLYDLFHATNIREYFYQCRIWGRSLHRCSPWSPYQSLIYERHKRNNNQSKTFHRGLSVQTQWTCPHCWELCTRCKGPWWDLVQLLEIKIVVRPIPTIGALALVAVCVRPTVVALPGWKPHLLLEKYLRLSPSLVATQNGLWLLFGLFFLQTVASSKGDSSPK